MALEADFGTRPSDYCCPVTRASGGIGRRAGFRFLCPKGCGGSSPPSPTNQPIKGLVTYVTGKCRKNTQGLVVCQIRHRRAGGRAAPRHASVSRAEGCPASSSAKSLG